MRPNYIIRFSTALYLCAALSSCEGLLDIDPPTSKVSADILFRDDATATSTVTGIYVEMLKPGTFSSGSAQSLMALTALSSDELVNYFPENTLTQEFYVNSILPDNELILSTWTSAYKLIYETNSVIEGISNSTTLTASVKDQLLGEALFVRAFVHFNLTNMFGEVPLIITTDYRRNTSASKASIDELYTQIVDDLLRAQSLMAEVYPSADRVRPNKFTATALLSRVYLYRKDWQNAEIQASSIINNPMYRLETDLNNVFLSNSKEAIWQLRPFETDKNTLEGYTFILEDGPSDYALRKDLINSFDNNDARLINWIGQFDTGADTLYFPYKYKVKYTGAFIEYSMVFRLAEQYLIRAEARTYEENLSEAITDLDIIRSRSGLPLINDIDPSISKSALINRIEEERRHELFTEWGHRWFDLKRTERANDLLIPIKPEWQETDVLYPLPDLEISRNPNLGDNNPGY